MIDKENQILSTGRALAFFPPGGTSTSNSELQSKKTAEKKSSDLSPNFLKSPSDEMIEPISQIALRFNKDPDEVNLIIEKIFSNCGYFKIQDINQIAYIFATISGESNFGARMIESTNYLIHRYEPVFSSDSVINTKSTPYKQLKETELFLLKEISRLYKNSEADKSISESLEELHSNVDQLLSEIDDEFLTEFLSQIKANDLTDIMAKFVNKKNLLRYCNGKNFDIKKIIVAKLRKTPPPAPDSPNFLFYTLQLKVLFIDWLITRIRSATNLGNTTKGDGEAFKGRGFVQITGRYNYKKFNTLLHNTSSLFFKSISEAKPENIPDIVETPDTVTDLDISSVIAVGGMAQGLFTRRKLSDYIKSDMCDFAAARNIINPNDNLAREKFKDYAEDFVSVMKK